MARGTLAPTLHALSAVGAGAHLLFETLAGSGLILQRRLGLTGAAATWTAGLLAWVRMARLGRSPRLLAAAGGGSVTTVALHFYVWPWSIRRGFPALDRAEGFDPSWVPAYNAVFYGWGLAGLGAILSCRRSDRPWTVVGAVGAIAMTSEVLSHYAWLQEHAWSRPAWWNRSGRRRPGLDVKPQRRRGALTLPVP